MPRIAFDATTPVVAEGDRACSVLSRLVGEPLIGRTPPIAQGFLLFEENGPWGSDSAARSPQLPASLRAAAIARKIRLQLIRRHRARRGDPARTLMVAWVGRDGGWLETATTDDPVALAGTLDLDALAAGQRPGVGQLSAEPVVLVCTQGGVDPCCAKFGRPIATTLVETYGPMVWEASHVGLCRFAANILCLPAGLVYGHTTPDLALRQVDALLAGRMLPDGLRGHAGVHRAVQTAELAVRHRVDRWELDALSCLAYDAADGRYQVAVGVGDRAFDVTLTEAPGTERPAGCRDGDLVAYDELHVVELTERAVACRTP